MPDRVQDLKNHRQVAVACKNYTDSEIKKSEERILSIVARNNVDFIDHINEATYRFTAPANAKLLMLQSIAGNSNKIAPSTPSDDSVARLKVIPDNTYKSQIDYIGGKTVKYNQFLREINSTNWGVANSDYGSVSFNGNEIIYTNTVVVTGYNAGVRTNNYISTSDFPNGHKGIIICKAKASEVNNDTKIGFDILNRAGTFSNNLTTSYQQFAEFFVSNSSNPTYICYRNNPVLNANLYIRDVVLVDLTAIFGSGNEPTSVDTAIPLLKANGYKLDGTDTYSTSSLKHAITTSANFLPINVWDIGNVLNQFQGACNYSNNSISNIYTDTRNEFNISIQVYNSGTFIRNIERTTIQSLGNRYYFTFNSGVINNDEYIRIKHNGATQDIGLMKINNVKSNTTYCMSYELVSNNPQVVGGLVLKEPCINISNANYNGNYYPYVAPITKTIPSEVLADTRYGLGYDDNNYNKLDSDGHLRGKYKPKTYSGSEVYGSTGSNYSNIIYYKIRKPLDYVGYNSYSTMVGNVKNTKFEISSPPSFDNSNYIGTINSMAENTAFWIGFAVGTTLEQAQAQIDGLKIVYEVATAFDEDYSQYFDTNWNKVDLDNQYATCEMIVDEPIDMPNKVEYYGTIIHALATAVKQDGFNVWDEEIEIGAINSTTGQKENNPSGNYWRSKNYFEVIANQTYFVKQTDGYTTSNANMSIYFYEDNYNYISRVQNVANTTVVIPSNCKYIMFQQFFINATQTTPKGICINISNQDLNGTYKPYKAPITRLLPNSEAKYSWGITNGVRNTRVFCDDECNPVNEGQLDVGNQDLGGLNYVYITDGENPYMGSNAITNAMAGNNYEKANILCAILETQMAYDIRITGLYGIALDHEKKIRIATSNMGTNAQTFKTDMNGEPLWYQKNATDTETLDDFDFSFDCEEGDTFTIIGCELLQCYATYSFLIKEAKSNE